MSWNKVKLSKVLKQYRVTHIVQNDRDYKQVTISKHDGVKFRGLKNGKEIGRKRQFIIDLKKYPNTLMLVRQGVYDGAIGIAPIEVDGCIATENMPMFSIEGINIDFLNLIIQSPYFKEELEKIPTTGSAQKSIHERQILEIEIPLPKPEIQGLIVQAFKQNQLGLNDISTELTHQLDLVKQLRQAFLREAMQGKLIVNGELSMVNETDEKLTTNHSQLTIKEEPASVLLEKIKAEKERLIKEKKIKRQKPLPPITEEEIPFEIPENWVWCRLKDIVEITGGGTPSKGRSDYWNGDIPWISPKDMKSLTVSDSELKVTEKGVKNSSTKMIPEGSLLVVGRSGILKRTIPVAINEVACTVNQDMKVLIPFLKNMNRFIQNMLFGIEEILLKEYVKFGMTVHSLKYSEFELMPIPLPPLSEQQRIVAKLDELMQYCDELETSIKESQQQNELLLQQVLREALEPKEKEVEKV